ncbi:MAG: hypothetical protein ABL857_07200, partial [Rickettsiales bacterium]
YPTLDAMCLSILEGINSQCNAVRLSLSERTPSSPGKVARPSIFYSEPMEFLGMLLNLAPEAFPLPDLDLSVGLQTTKLSFGFNAIEAQNKITGKRNFGSMLRLKQYIDMPIDAVDCVLQAPIEFIVSQSFSFVPANRALKHYKSQNTLFGMSGDIKSNDDFGINKVFSFNQNSPVNFVEHQTSIMILTDDLRKLDKEVARFFNKISILGLAVVREDIQMEESFWAQFPGNFEFIRNIDYLPAEQVGGLCRLNCYHTGEAINNHWGERLALVPTSVGSPYFFNFHVQDNGHTVLFDYNSFEDKTGEILEYFLLTKTRKLGARLFIFDRNQSARLLLNKLNGKYFPMVQLEKISRDKLADKTARLSLNPFALPPSNYNNSFLAAWCGLLVSPDAPLDEKDSAILSDAVERLYAMPSTERNLPGMVALVTKSDPALGRSLEHWIGKGKYAGLFDFAEDSLDVEVDLFGVDMTSALASPAFALPLFSYLMHRVIDSIDGSPTIIVINEAWDLLENYFFSPRLESLLEMLRQRNVMVLFTTSNPANCLGTETLSAVMEASATKIYIPDEVATDYKSEDLGLNDYDAVLLLSMARPRGDFLVKQQGESISLCVSVEEMEDVSAIFTNDTKNIVSARGRFAGTPKDY